MRRREAVLLVMAEPSLRWHCRSCGEWGVCDDADLCIACALGEVTR
jgi:hypothetical protein